MSGKKNTLVSVFQMRCPQCREGKLFESHSYNLKKVGKMHKNCNVCGKSYTPEPGFYFGATYVSYALTVAVAFVTFWAVFPFIGFSWSLVNTYLIIIGIVLALLTPWLYRLSRTIWLYMFSAYKPETKITYQESLKKGSDLHRSDVN